MAEVNARENTILKLRIELIFLCFDHLDQKLKYFDRVDQNLVCFDRVRRKQRVLDRARPKREMFRPCLTKKCNQPCSAKTMSRPQKRWLKVLDSSKKI